MCCGSALEAAITPDQRTRLSSCVGPPFTEVPTGFPQYKSDSGNGSWMRDIAEIWQAQVAVEPAERRVTLARFPLQLLTVDDCQ